MSAIGAPSNPGVATERSPLSRSVARWRPAHAIAAVVAGMIAAEVLGYGISEAAGDTDAAIGIGLIVSDLLLLAIVLWVARQGAERLGGRTLGLRRTAFGPALGWSCAVLVASFAVNGLLAVLFGDGSTTAESSSTGTITWGLLILFAVGIAVVVPIVEEITFRGYLFPALTTWRGPWTGAFSTALLFGAAHAFSLPVPFQIGAAVFGFGACLLYWFTGSLLPGIVLHSFNNAIVLAIVTEGRLALAVIAAPVLALLLTLPFCRDHAQRQTAASKTDQSIPQGVSHGSL